MSATRRIAVPLTILIASGLIAAGLVSLRSEAEQVAPEPVVPRVEVVELASEDAVARLETTGVVQAAEEIVLHPQVSGRIVWQSDDLEPGGRVTRGQVLARIDPAEYELALEQARSTVQQAEVSLELERGRKRISEEEWAILGEDRDPADAPLALRGPQLRASEQALVAARASLKQAELNLQRTYLVAPFNAMIIDESIDRGQVVGPTSRVATLIGTDEVWVTVSIPVEQLPAVVLPDDDAEGSRARVEQRLGGETSVVRSGSVARLLGQLDPQTRTAQLLVAVPNPLEGEADALGEPVVPLLPGAYVDVVLEGRILEEVFRVPRTAVEEGNKVWVVETEGTLASRRVRVGWRDASDVVVTEGLDEGTHLVVSPLALPIEGMPVQARLLPHPSTASAGHEEK